jgi:hypothetical protein
MQPEAHEPLQGITLLLVHNIKLSCVLNMLHLITNTAASFQPRQLYSGKLNWSGVLYVNRGTGPTIPLRCDLTLNTTRRKCLTLKSLET